MPATPTYILLNQVTLAANTSTISFSSIPSNYRDLRIVITGTLSTSVTPALRYNGDSGNNYHYVTMGGTAGAGAYSGAGANVSTAILGWYTQVVQGRFIAIGDIMDYSATDKHKTMIARGSDNGVGVDATASRWANTAAISTITVTGYDGAGVYAAGTTFYLYGLVA